MYKAAAIRGLCFLFTLFCVYGFAFFPDKDSGRYRGSKGVIFSGTPENEYKKQDVFPGTLFPGVKPEETAIPAADTSVAHWVFKSTNYSGGVWRDKSGNGYHATASQAPSYDGGGNWLLDGSSDYASPGDVLDDVWTGASGWTIELKLTPASGGGATQALVLKDAYPVGRSFWLRLDSLVPEVRWYDTNIANWSETRCGTTLSIGTSYILRVTYDPTQAVGSRVSFYLDGSADTGSNTTTGSPSAIRDSTIHLGIGERLDPSGSPITSIPYKGSMEYLKIWDSVKAP